MATPLSFRLPANLDGKAEPEVVEAIGWHDDAINDLQQAIPSLKSQIDALKPTSAGTSSTTNVTNSGQTVVVQPEVIGTVNQQSGTSYSTQQADYGSFVQFTGSAAVAVSLTTGTAIQLPWYAWIQNFTSNTVTLTPLSGTLNGGASLAVAANQSCLIVFDGTNFEATLVPVAPQTATPVTGEYVTGYNTATGAFSLSTPAGIAATVVLAKLTAGGANGSLTVVGGLITAYTAPS